MRESSVDLTGFLSMVQDLAQLAPDKTMREVTIASIGQLLKNCIQHTPERTPGEIAKVGRGNYIKFADGTVISRWRSLDRGGERQAMYLDPSTWDESKNTGKHKKPAPKAVGGMTWHDMNNPERRWSGARWATFLYKDAQRMRIAAQKQMAAEAAIGLAKKTWWQIGEALGCDPAIAAAHVRAARSPDGREHIEGIARQVIESAAFFIECENSNPLLCGKLDGESIVVNGLAARQKAYDTDIEKGAFDGIKQRAKRYPGVFTDP
jgi:hypothetical protein